ncbi:hypothetical protein [Polynucleobacter sp. MWH-UH35A]|uniref:hypothetical protein n=1 Tax=Polynucleobacter sp. MWH-UH35A TaxID=1855619 RepID=UPI001BFD94DF|nr:hypothetical protein [Polynucleobacter sp. MWH-UH35A]QWD59704.1 hypothetical protein ICV36_07830 [Polynucleobacter sp. MWH-UH35A]
MSDPRRHDIFEDENGTRVAVRQVFPPNALGISFVEYKNLVDSNLRFLPQSEFLEQFRWVENFDSTDTFSENALLQGGVASSADVETESKEVQESTASPPVVSSDDGAGDQSSNVRPSRLE